MLGDPVTDLTLALEVNYFRQAKDRYFVPISVKIPGAILSWRAVGAGRARAWTSSARSRMRRARSLRRSAMILT